MDGFPFLNFFGEADNPSYLDPNLGLPTLHQEDTHQDTVVYPFEDEEEKKRKEEKRKELKQLILNEVTSVSSSRRTRRGVVYEDPNAAHEESAKSQKVRAIVKLPSMFPHQVGVSGAT